MSPAPTIPGFDFDMPAAQYHADPCPRPSLSSSIARTIINKSLAHAFAEHPKLGGTSKKAATPAMDRGALVHALISGKSVDEIETEEFATFRSKVAQEWADRVRAAGKIPALQDDLDAAHPIVAALRAKVAVGLSSSPFSAGRHEVSAAWERDGVWFRARYDLLELKSDEPSTAWDFKVTSDVSPGAVKRAFRRYGYHHQAAHYLAGLDALLPAFRGRHSFVFAFVEDAEPYSVRRYCLNPDTLGCAAIDMHRAHDAWARAINTGMWPDATTERTTFIDIPTYDDDASDEIHAAA